MPYLYVILLCTVIFPGTVHADLESELTTSEYAAMGLGKLTDKERDALFKWIQSARNPGQSETQPSADLVAPNIRRIKPTPIKSFESHIVGAFTGWEGKTRFRLANGQTWQQRTLNRYRYAAQAPAVRFKKNIIGFWEMEIVETGRSVGVKLVD